MLHVFKNTGIALLLLLQAAPAKAREKQLHFPAAGDYNAPGGLRIGFGLGQYTRHVSGPEIYMWRVNNGYSDYNRRILEVSDKFGSMQDFKNIHLAYESEDGPGIFTYEFSYSARFKVCDARFTYDTGPATPTGTRYEKAKMTLNTGSFSLIVNPPKMNWLRPGASMDIGFLRTKIKVEDDLAGNSDGWQPWFWSFKLLGSDVTPKAPVAGVSVFALMDFKVISLRITHMIPMLNGSLNSETGKYSNIPWSQKVFPIQHTVVTAYIKIKP
jgi:hypothetical protein